MSEEKKSRKRKPFAGTLIFGAISLVSYFMLLSHQEWVTDYYTRGGYYAAFPIVTAFWFSFMHGTFGSNLLSVLGLEAKKTKSKK